MKKVIILSVVLVFALVSVSWAVLPSTGPRITYGGYVQKNPDGTVNADTLICVFNPNNFVINGVGIAVFDKYGVKVADTLLIDGGIPIASIPAKGWGWQTVGNMIGNYVTPNWLYPGVKYTFVVYWTAPTQLPNRGLVAEIKEIIFYGYIYPSDIWYYGSAAMKVWSEAAVGKGDKGTGYSAQ